MRKRKKEEEEEGLRAVVKEEKKNHHLMSGKGGEHPKGNKEETIRERESAMQWSKVWKTRIGWAASTAAEKLSDIGDMRQCSVPENLGKGRRLTLKPELKS